MVESKITGLSLAIKISTVSPVSSIFLKLFGSSDLTASSKNFSENSGVNLSSE
jgi:hypothetical protein